MNVEELLAAHNIKLKSTAPGRHYTTCPECSAGRSTREHQLSRVLGVTIEGDRVRWGCSHCDWTGPQPGAVYGARGRPNGAAANGATKEVPPLQPDIDDARIDWKHPEAEFIYADRNGATLYKNVRYPLLHRDGTVLLSDKGKPDKTFRQARWEGGRWINGLGGIKPVPYRLPELITAVKADQVVFIVEGEAKADRLRSLGFAATSLANKVCAESHAELFRGADIALLPDNDQKGDVRANEIGSALVGVAKNVFIVRLPRLATSGDDIIDWLDKYRGTREELLGLYETAPLWRADRAPPTQPEPPPGPPSGFYQDQEGLRQYPERGEHGPDQESAPGSESVIEPVDLWGQFDPPSLPKGLLPAVIEEFALEEAELMGADPCGLAMAALSVCAAALPDHIKLQVKRYDPNWLEEARAWVGLIGNPSTKKTPIMRRATKSFNKLDAKFHREYLAEMEVYDSYSKEEQKQHPRPVRKQLCLEDVTIEAAQEVFKGNRDGVLCHQDELFRWFGSMDKYSGRGGGNKDRGFWLQTFNGGSYSVNRVGRGSYMIGNLSMCLLGGIQPDAIRNVAAETVDDGLLQRLTPIMLRSGRAGKDTPTSYAGRRYDVLVETLHTRQAPPNPFQFSDGARAIRETLEQKHLDLMAGEIVNKKLAAHIGKYDGMFARWCLLWHCIEGGPGSTIAEGIARRVADFMHYFLLPHAAAFYTSILELSDDHERLTKVAGYILAKKLERISSRDVQAGVRSMRGLGKHQTESIFQQLEALGWLIQEPDTKAARSWLINPEVHRRFKERAAREVAERKLRQEAIKEIAAAGRRGRNW
jgi:hypothetical protein